MLFFKPVVKGDGVLDEESDKSTEEEDVTAAEIKR